MAVLPRPAMYASWEEWADKLVDALGVPEVEEANTVIKLPYFSAAILPKAVLPGGFIYLSDGGVVAPIFSDGEKWRRVSDNSEVTTALVTVVSTTPHNMDTSEYIVAVNATGGARLVNLPAAADAMPRPYYIKKTDSSGNAVTVDGDGSETIDGELTIAMDTQFASLTIFSDGSNWHVI